MLQPRSPEQTGGSTAGVKREKEARKEALSSLQCARMQAILSDRSRLSWSDPAYTYRPLSARRGCIFTSAHESVFQRALASARSCRTRALSDILIIRLTVSSTLLRLSIQSWRIPASSGVSFRATVFPSFFDVQ